MMIAADWIWETRASARCKPVTAGTQSASRCSICTKAFWLIVMQIRCGSKLDPPYVLCRELRPMGLISTARFIIDHPLSRGRKLANLSRFACWQIGARLARGPIATQFVNSAQLPASPGMTGATGNVYVGLHEFADMSFILHFLRPNDLFVDVGANVG